MKQFVNEGPKRTERAQKMPATETRIIDPFEMAEQVRPGHVGETESFQSGPVHDAGGGFSRSERGRVESLHPMTGPAHQGHALHGEAPGDVRLVEHVVGTWVCRSSASF